MIKVYDLREDPSLQQMQEASVGDSDFGLSPMPALIGTDAWWSAVGNGDIPSTHLKGVITDVQWRSMGDWPTFKIESQAGIEESFTREGDGSRYVVGLAAEVRYVVINFKAEVGGLINDKVVTEVWLEDSPRRTERQPPGPDRILERGSTAAKEVTTDGPP